MLAAVATCVLAATSLSWGTAYSAFTRTTGTGSDSWTTGTVTFGANSPTGALFAVSGAVPGVSGSACVKVTYTGSLPVQVRLYVASGGLTGTGLGSYLTLQVNEGTGSQGTCGDFASAANDYNATGLSDTTKTVATFASAATNFGTGVSGWSATQNATRTYQFRWQLQDDNGAAGKSAAVTFTWEAQS